MGILLKEVAFRVGKQLFCTHKSLPNLTKIVRDLVSTLNLKLYTLSYKMSEHTTGQVCQKQYRSLGRRFCPIASWPFRNSFLATTYLFINLECCIETLCCVLVNFSTILLSEVIKNVLAGSVFAE